jgi:hypothetical protein
MSTMDWKKKRNAMIMKQPPIIQGADWGTNMGVQRCIAL